MTQEQQLNITLKEEDRVVYVKQGGTLIWDAKEQPYFKFSFVPRENLSYNETVKEEFLQIGYALIEKFSKDKVVRYGCSYSKKEREIVRKKKFTDPVYIEDGKVNEFKQYLMNSDRKDLLWTDYMFYISELHPWKIFKLLGTDEIRSYTRDIHILQEKLDIYLAEKALASREYFDEKGMCVFVYPHSKIKYKETERETVISYVHDNDFLIFIAVTDYNADITINPNPCYMTYDQLLKEIEPVFNKYGWNFGDVTNPYLKEFGCNVNCNNCDSYCYYNFNPDKKLSEPRINRKNPKPTSKGLTSRGDVWY